MPIGVANADKRPILADQETVERGDQDLIVFFFDIKRYCVHGKTSFW
ncbi:MAG: hypothetical protein WAT36_00750 [Chromatiaceae bacterium]